jgi:hypothetical protein
MGHKATFRLRCVTSPPRPKANVYLSRENVAYVPEGDSCIAANAVQGRNDLLDQTVSLFTASGAP